MKWEFYRFSSKYRVENTHVPTVSGTVVVVVCGS